MKNTNTQYAVALYEVTKDLIGADLTAAIENFVKVLSRDHKLRQANAIIAEFERYAKKQAGVVSIEITSAGKLDNAVTNKIKKVFGDKVEAEEMVDKSLIGGVRIMTEDRILDGSIKTQLQNMKRQLV
ncbi:MAG: ATP synthase F1 subunit delta [Patescibacteria group bacterium]